MTKSTEGVVAIGLIESAFGGTMIESWVLPDVQLARCSNITCASNQTEHFTPETKAGCLAGGVLRDRGLEVPPVPSYDWPTATAIGAGANGYRRLSHSSELSLLVRISSIPNPQRG